MVTSAPANIVQEIKRLKEEKNAVLLAHNYERPEVQDVADFVGDSLSLSRTAASTKADVIVFCGVHFMAETAKILSPDKTVLLPDLEAGCSLAATITAEDLRRWKRDHPGAIVVTYVNTTAEVKAESDYCCTSSNAVKIVSSIPSDKEILFAPDMYLGQYVMEKTSRRLHLWPGSCHVHHKIRPEKIQNLRKEHPQAEFLIHPECGCSSAVLKEADKVLSTEGMIRHAYRSSAKEFIVATEVGILHRMQKESPDKKFYPAERTALCEFMKMITLEKVLWSLQDLQYEISVPPDIAARAKKAIDRMVELVD
jgi:quinolinate synthase